MPERQNLTIKLSKGTIRKAKIIAASRGTSISKMVADLVEKLVAEDSLYKAAEQGALEYLDKGFHLGGGTPVDRDELHER